MPIGRNLEGAASLEYQALSQASTRWSELSRITCWQTCCGPLTWELKAADDADFRGILRNPRPNPAPRTAEDRLKSSGVRMLHEGQGIPNESSFGSVYHRFKTAVRA